MKKVCISILLMIFLLVSCGNSPTDKAEALIEEDMVKNLYIPDSYESVETKVDSAFAPFDSPELYYQISELLEMDDKTQEYENKVKHAKSSIAIWGNPYDAFSRNRHEESKAEYKEYMEKLNAIQKRITKTADNIRKIVRQEPRFIGYKAVHRYRAKNNAGQVLMGNQLYILNGDLTKIIASYDMESREYTVFHEVVERVMEEINE